MQFSQNWLYTWINPELPADQLAHLLTMAGLEVEETMPAAPDFSKVVIAEVKSVTKHPDADRLNITQVDIGNGELTQIVCGAPNVAVGIKIPCCLPGAILPNGLKIKPTKMRGQVSNGMLCSAKELGLADESQGLLILPADAPVGMDIREYLALNDHIHLLKITPNRADCLSIKGLAREVAALTQKPLQPVTIEPVTASIDATQPVRIEAPADCGRFLSRVIQAVDPKAATPLWLQQRLQRSGLHSVNALVDIGNYVMLELGQPMHVFDADKINGALTVRRAQNGEQLACLNDKTVTLADNTLVVADQQQVLSIAGLMGGKDSSVTDTTHNVVLECAWFTPEIIAGKSRQYGFGSDSSFRYERGVDYELQHEAIERATALILSVCGGQAGAVTEALGQLPDSREVKVRTARVAKVLGIELSAQAIGTILTHLGLQPKPCEDGFIVTVPSFRFDIAIEVDLIEEIGRVYGYENIPAQFTHGQLNMTALPETQKQSFSAHITLATRGYQEVISYAFVDEAWERDLANNTDPIRLQNPIASHMSVMRSTLFGGLIEILQRNLNRKQNRVRLFEMSRTFRKHPVDHSFIQTPKIAGLAYGSALPEQWSAPARMVDFYDVKADIAALFYNRRISYRPLTTHPALHPGRSAEIICEGQVIGVVGELHPRWLQQYDLTQAPVLFELSLNAVLQHTPVHYQSVSKFQPVFRDLAFIVPDEVSAAALLDALAQVKDNAINHMTLFDVYRGQGIDADMKSLAVKIRLQSQDHTLTDDEVEAIIQQFIEAAKSVNARLRS
ncbi:phenylalanine--tRNA ligase subunit beta [Neisseriaceae bacterium ESL0693]|nr:phenylalanine--tRNA ligase subunit beta [Neisseriaceae bacterium ESL0693]